MRHSVLMLSIASVLLAAGCTPSEAPAPATPGASTPAAATAAAEKIIDDHSYAEADKVRTKDLALDLDIDFAKHELAGTATYTLEWLDQSATQLVLDTRDLSIQKAEGEAADGQWQPLEFALAPTADKVLGTKLTVQTPQRPGKVRVTYRTSPEASGLQWLTPAQTEGKKSPFMFSQSQQIHARSWVPLQDTPQIRFTYSATVRAPQNVMVLMSADNDPYAARDGEYSFRMPQPIPSYLLAIAAGDLVFKPISARSGVWAEPAMVDKAVREFEDTEKMIEVTEKLYGPYRWDRYDMLVLPPSFPYGGMENPRLTFATPTVIVGDKSLVSLIAHELAHSWSGNLVTFATDRDAWLNEGFTTYVQGRITEALYGEDAKDMEDVIDRDELRREYQTLDKKLQVMALKPGELGDPDGSSSATVYTKGAWMLQWLERTFGREVFDPFLKGYFDHFAFQSITTGQFLDYLKTHLIDKNPGKATMEQVEQWVYEPGVPDFAPQVSARPFGVVTTARTAWLGDGTMPARQLTDAWSTHEWVHFLEGMPETLEHEQLKQLDDAFGFTGTPNGEIAMRWYPLAVRSGYAEANDEMAKFIERVGRRKLIMPIYAELVKTPEGLALARQVYARAKPGYHPITSGSVESVIARAEGK
ncbi:M1 family metallopeptidase [Luteimonas sp. e5]